MRMGISHEWLVGKDMEGDGSVFKYTVLAFALRDWGKQ
jgi:hypothetical protein